MATLARPFRPWEILLDLHLGLRPPAADYDLGYLSAALWAARTTDINRCPKGPRCDSAICQVA